MLVGQPVQHFCSPAPTLPTVTGMWPVAPNDGKNDSYEQNGAVKRSFRHSYLYLRTDIDGRNAKKRSRKADV